MSYASQGLGGPAVDRWKAVSADYCYSKELSDCVMDRSYAHPICAEYKAADRENEDKTQAVIYDMPFCSDRPPWKLIGIAAGSSLVLGLLLGVLAMR